MAADRVETVAKEAQASKPASVVTLREDGYGAHFTVAMCKAGVEA